MAVFLYYGEFSSFTDTERLIAFALDRSGHFVVSYQRDPDRFDRDALLARLTRDNVKVLLLTKTPEIKQEDILYIKSHWNGLVVWWTFDWMLHPEVAQWYVPLAQVSDICFQTDGWGEATEYRKLRINRVELHQAADPQFHYIPTSVTKHQVELFGYDVIFCGSLYTDRRVALAKELERYRFLRVGPPGEEVWGKEFTAMCYLGKIIIGDNYTNDLAGYWSNRVYMTLGCGGFYLQAYVPGLEMEFKNHEHMVWFRSFDEMHELIEYYLPREAERRRIALNGHALVYEKHLYEHRIAALTQHLHALDRRVPK